MPTSKWSWSPYQLEFLRPQMGQVCRWRSLFCSSKYARSSSSRHALKSSWPQISNACWKLLCSLHFLQRVVYSFRFPLVFICLLRTKRSFGNSLAVNFALIFRTIRNCSDELLLEEAANTLVSFVLFFTFVKIRKNFLLWELKILLHFIGKMSCSVEGARLKVLGWRCRAQILTAELLK